MKNQPQVTTQENILFLIESIGEMCAEIMDDTKQELHIQEWATKYHRSAEGMVEQLSRVEHFLARMQNEANSK